MILQAHKASAVDSEKTAVTAFGRVDIGQNCPKRRSFPKGGGDWMKAQIAVVDPKSLRDQFSSISLRQHLPKPHSGCDIPTPISNLALGALIQRSFPREPRLQPTLTCERYY